MVVNLICSYNNVIFLLNFICIVFLFVFVLFLFNLINITLFIMLIYATLINLLFLVNGILLMSSYNYIYYSLSSHFIISNYDISFKCASIINQYCTTYYCTINNHAINMYCTTYCTTTNSAALLNAWCLALYIALLNITTKSEWLYKWLVIYYKYWCSAWCINHNFNNIIIHISTIHFYNLCYLSSYSTLLNIGLNRLGHVIFDNSLFCLIFTVFFINLINLNIIFYIMHYYSLYHIVHHWSCTT